MPKKEWIKKVLVLGSGPIVIGQAAEFDYAGTQACRSLKEERVEVVLVNSNPATIMTDGEIADHVYIEPLNKASVTQIIEMERPDSLLPTLGGQTGLNLAVALTEDGTLEKYGVKLLGTSAESIRRAEDRQGFKDAMEKIGQPCVESTVVGTVADAEAFAAKIGLPVIIRPAYTLGGTGGGIAYTMEQLHEIASTGIHMSRVGQILVERCISGWKEIEFEVIRDGAGNVITVCSMENVDPVGIHTGDSIVVAPSQTLADKEYQMLRTAALDIITELGIEGGCNVQFALHPDSYEYAVIEVNPRVSRSSALASKATGYPIARVTAKIALGYHLDEIRNAVTGKTCACFEPMVDYCVVKMPKWPFDKFTTASRTLGTQMKATGEVMTIATSFEAALMKSLRSLEQHVDSLQLQGMERLTTDHIYDKLQTVDDERLFVIAEALRRGITVEEINAITKVDIWFLDRINDIVQLERRARAEGLTPEVLRACKEFSFPDTFIARLTGTTPEQIYQMRQQLGLTAVFKMVDTCAAEFDAETPYYYATYDQENESHHEGDQKTVLVLGSGPIRIGQGVEFDYCSVHCVWAFRRLGWRTVIINNNPETVSTDFDVADALYFEPLTAEDVRNVVDLEKPVGAVVQFGGQTAIKLTQALTDMGVPILGTDAAGVDAAEDREKFDEILKECQISKAEAGTVFTAEEAKQVAARIGYPVLVRPSYVIGGQGMEIAYNDRDIENYMSIINRYEQEHPVLVDKYLMGREVEVDAVCDGEDILIPGIMEHIERAGIHSGDSISVYPPVNIEQKHIDEITEYTRRLAKALKVVGLVNIQFVIYNDRVYVIEVNPRSSRTIPYISKVTGVPIISLAVRAILGEKLQTMGYGTGLYRTADYYAVKMPVFSFQKLTDVDTGLGPEMKSTGEVLGIDEKYPQALLKAFLGANFRLPKRGEKVILSVRNTDYDEIKGVARGFEEMGCVLYATEGTCKAIRSAGIECTQVARAHESSPNIMDMIAADEVALVINTPNHGKNHERSGFRIRRACAERNIGCITAIDTAKALLRVEQQGVKRELVAVDVAQLQKSELKAHQLVLVLDFGGQYNQLIARRVRECGVYCEVKPYTMSVAEIRERHPIGIIFTGGPNSVYDPGAPTVDPEIFKLGIPVLGICYGCQLMAHLLGGTVSPATDASAREYGHSKTKFYTNCALFQDLPAESVTWMSHGDYISVAPFGFSITATTETCPTAAIANAAKGFYGVQFHPEVNHTEYGQQMLRNFLYRVCHAKGDWTMGDYLKTAIQQIRERVGEGKVLLGLSGGVDSSVCAALLSQAVGNRLTCIFVDHGLMRKDEGDEVEAAFSGRDMQFVRVNAEERFLTKLAGVSDPEKKRKIIGEEFIRVFEEEAKKIGTVDFLAQGTIYPDVIESGLGNAAVIKSHHNVGGLPDYVDFREIIEPLRLLFKDEVRQLGRELQLPESLVMRQPFPGPGLAVRVIGEITKEKLDILRDADDIFRKELEKDGLAYNQYFAVLTDMRSVGVMGDSRTYDYTLALRAVETSDFMTADWAKIPYETLERISRRIVNEVRSINRIVYDITSKPPATIEWE